MYACINSKNHIFVHFGAFCSPPDALVEAFVKTDVAFREELDYHRKSKGVIQKDWHPGCTAIVALIVQNKLFVANAGDCRAMLCQANSAHPLSKVRWEEHVP